MSPHRNVYYPHSNNPSATSFSSAGAPIPKAYGRAGDCCACSRCETGRLFFLFCFFFVVVVVLSRLSSFSKASSLGRRLDILKYCGLGR